MNLHHLELFYFVAKYEGIVKACREIPYGVQQPAVSSQLIQLEEELGLRLFERKPFSLTTPGEYLYGFVAPFFNGLADVEAEIKGSMSQEIRLAGSSELLRDYAPNIIRKLRKKFPGMKLKLTAASQSQAEQLILSGEADLAVTVLETTLPPGVKHKKLIELPLILLLPRENYKGIKSVRELMKGSDEALPSLIALRDRELLTRLFQGHLKKLKLKQWLVDIEVNSLDLVAAYVAQGMGVGISADIPSNIVSPQIKTLPLQGFPKLPVGAFWRGKLRPATQAFYEELVKVVAKIEG
ncbi:MAG: LysR family transcriptional regulator [Verrucomicrobiota bacterium]